MTSRARLVATRTYLQMTTPLALRPARLQMPGLAVLRDASCDPALWRMLYTEVGRQYRWTDRLPWTDEEAGAYLADPAISSRERQHDSTNSCSGVGIACPP